MAKSKSHIIEIPEIEKFEKRFHFIENNTLRTNLSIALQYVVFILKVEADFNITGAIEYSIYKNIIQYTSSIVEGVMHYGLEVAIKEGLVIEEKIMPKAEVFRERKRLYKINSKEEILGVKKIVGYEKYKKNTQFKTICDAYKRGKLFSDELIEEVNELRDKRNKIHLAGLTKVENYYTKKDINQAFELAAKVIDEVEKLVKN
ncbi:MAG: hypothetical protein WD048_16805 [Chitinophagales bacterium]